MVRQCKKVCPLPVIATLRSAQEGGRYFGSPEEWAQKIAPVIPLVDYVDVEQQFAREAGPVTAAGRAIIASHHEAQMMPLHVLFVLEQELRAYGDIPKIIVTPGNEDDLIDLIAFTRAAKKPVCTGVMGTSFRYARVILPLFGSEFVYCHTGGTDRRRAVLGRRVCGTEKTALLKSAKAIRQKDGKKGSFCSCRNP